jgi:hypothetical protein
VTAAAGAHEPPRWRTIVGDVLGFAAVIWSIPFAILLIGAPIVIVVAIITTTLKSIFG